MRTTLDLDADVVGAARELAAAQRRSLGSVISELARRGLPMYLASGTDEPFVKREAELLGLTRYFGPHIYGAQDDFKTFSKKMVIDRIIRENDIQGEQLLSFGDGYVEIENVKQVGGVTVGVATDEPDCLKVDDWKRNRLAGVGADYIIPNFLCHGELFKLLFPE